MGCKSDFIVCDTVCSFLDENEYSPDVTMVRASPDNVSNGHGVKLLDLCKSIHLRNVNGRIGQTDKYTYASRNGASVIDFLVTGEHNCPCIHDFTVGDFTEWNDRAPLHFSLLSKTDLQPDSDSNGVKYQWDSKNTLEYRSLLITKLPELNQVIHNIDCNSRDSINKALIQVTEIIRSIADPLCCKPCNKGVQSL